MPNDLKPLDLDANYDALKSQLSDLRDEMAKVAGSVATTTKANSEILARQMNDGMADMRDYISRQTKAADKRIEGAVADNPYVALALAAGVGILIGMMARR